jgi:hypothetical protein
MSIRRMSRFCRRIVLAGVALGCAIPAFAQVGYLWTPEELTAKAHAVVIVEVVATRDTKRTHHPSLRPMLPVVEVEVEIRVLAWLKPPAGSAPLPSTLRLSYFRRDDEQWRRENPTTADAPPRGLVNAGSTLALTGGPSRYLAFLSREPDGRYRPLSGQTFPATSLLRLCEADGQNC